MAFHGDKKEGKWLLADAENQLKDWLVPKVPLRIETYHLTVSTLLWCALIMLFSFFARFNIHCLWVVSLAIGVNTLIILIGKNIDIVRSLPFILVGATFALFVTVYQTQKELWRIDMEAKANPNDERPDAGAEEQDAHP